MYIKLSDYSYILLDVNVCKRDLRLLNILLRLKWNILRSIYIYFNSFYI